MKPNPLTACTSKKRYSTREEAEKTAAYLWQEKQVNVNVYKCILCCGFHLAGAK